jgi:regulator of extracellular matrix RemA (YlzA/DUF370 family)
MNPINIGFGNIVMASRIIAVVGTESAPVKRMIQEAREKGTLVDATQGRRTRAVIVVDSGHVVLSCLQPETVAGRISSRDDKNDGDL